MTPERRREIYFIILLEVARKEGIDLRKFRRDIGTQAEELGIPIEEYRELMKVVAACAFNEAIGVPALIPQALSSLPEKKLHEIAERVVEARFTSGKVDIFIPVTSILKKRNPEEEEKRREGVLEQIARFKELGVSFEEILQLFEENVRKVTELAIIKVHETVAVVVEQGSGT